MRVFVPVFLLLPCLCVRVCVCVCVCLCSCSCSQIKRWPQRFQRNSSLNDDNLSLLSCLSSHNDFAFHHNNFASYKKRKVLIQEECLTHILEGVVEGKRRKEEWQGNLKKKERRHKSLLSFSFSSTYKNPLHFPLFFFFFFFLHQ